MNKFKITTEIRAILLGAPGITALVDDKIFPLIAPEGTQGDFIIYYRDGYEQNYTQMGIAVQKPLIYVIAISEEYDNSQELATLIYEALEGNFHDPEMRIRLKDSTEDYEEGKYIQVLQFSVE